MADVDLRKDIRDFEKELTTEQKGLRDRLEAETRTLDNRLANDSQLNERQDQLKRLRERLESGSPDGTERAEIKEDIAETEREMRERKAELERARNEARQAWRESLSEGQRARLEKLGADLSRVDKGGSLTDPILEQEGRGAFEDSHGRQEWSQDLGKTADGKETTLEFTKKNGKSYAVILDSDGKVLEKIEFDPKSKSSVEDATKKIGRLGLKDYPGERVMLAFQMAFLVLFVLDAALTIKEMADPKNCCRMLQDYARLMLKGTWDDISLTIMKWMKDTTGPFNALAGYFNYLNAIGLGAYIDGQLGEPGSRKRQQLYKRLKAAADKACKSLTGDDQASLPSRKPLWWGAGAAALATLAAVIVYSVNGNDGSSSSGAGPETAAGVGAPNCDCMGVDAGLLTGPYREQCNARAFCTCT